LPDSNLVVLPLIMDAPGLQVPFENLRDLCFIGGYRHKPNQDAVKYFVQEVWPLVKDRLPEARFRIMGSHVPPDIQALHGDGVIVDGFVPDLPGSLGRCRLSVAPLRYGAGIKGKVGSSLGLGIPCVASPIAAEGMGLGPSDGVEIAATPAEMADRICRLYTDDAHWHRMSAGGIAFVDREYSMRAVGKRLRQILTDLGLPAAG
jgi:glycosyltransferase involved in cell wall biosynthesis